MTKEQLDSMQEMIEAHPKGSHAVFCKSHDDFHGAWMFDAERMKELLRLARLWLEYEAQALRPGNKEKPGER